MKLRLFTLRNTHTNKLSGEYYASKAEAKKARDELNEVGTPVWAVTPGPDHHRYVG